MPGGLPSPSNPIDLHMRRYARQELSCERPVPLALTALLAANKLAESSQACYVPCVALP